MSVLAALSKPLVIFFLTDKWLPCVSIMMLLCFSFMFSFVNTINLSLLQVKGRSDLFLKITAGNSHYFRICFLDPFQGTVLANYASSELKATKAYCLGENGNEYDQGLITFFKQAFEKAGGTVVTDSFPKDNSDFSSYLNKAKDQGCNVIFAPVSIAYSTQLVSQAASLNVAIPFLGSDTWDDNMVLQAAKGTSVQAFVSTFYAEGGNKTFDDGIKAYIIRQSSRNINS